MTLTKKSLKRLGDNLRIYFTSEQKRIILERFGTEPEEHEWSEQDIAEQIRKIVRDYPAVTKSAARGNRKCNTR
jgi:hypothetical protein